jgi:superfamily II DNA helicase RecQ
VIGRPLELLHTIAGPTILVSPLLALMRNQIRMAERATVGVACREPGA